MDTPLYNLQTYKRYSRSLKPLFENRTIQAYLMATTSLFAIAFFTLVAIRPTLQTIVVLRRRISDMETVDKRLEDKINMLIQAQQEYERIEADLPLVYRLLPPTPEFPSLLQKLELLAIENGATISGISFNPIVLYENSTAQIEQTTSPLDTEKSVEPEVALEQSETTETLPETPILPENLVTPIPFTVTLSAPYTSIKTISDQITELDRIITIELVTLTANKETAEIIINLNSESSSFYFPQRQ